MAHANDNIPWTAERRAESAAVAGSARQRAATEQAAEAVSVSRITKRIAKRQSIGDGWDGKVANDNIGWPLAKALLAEGRGHLLRYAMAYRRIEASANSTALLGGTSIGQEPVQVDYRTWIRPSDGAFIYAGERKVTASGYAEDIPCTQKVRTNDETMKPAAPVPKKWTGDDKVNDSIDNRRRLARIRERLGPLVEIFERLVIDGARLEDAGKELGVSRGKSASATARAMVIMGLYAVADEMGELRRDEVAA